MPRILAIDYGEKRTGLAWTDPLGIIATALPAMLTPEVLPWLEAKVGPEGVHTLVVGLPLRLDGSDTHSTAAAQAYARQLQTRFPQLKVVMADERLTSRLAQQAMVAGGASRKKRADKMTINSVSAVILLQAYMATPPQP